jgi:hypothetical protein
MGCRLGRSCVRALVVPAISIVIGCPGESTPSTSSTTSDESSGPEQPTDTTDPSEDSSGSAPPDTSTGAAGDESETGAGAPRWCDEAMPAPAACADFDGPPVGWIAPRPAPPPIEAAEDATVAASPPNSMRYSFTTDGSGTESVESRHTWSAPLDAVPGHLRGFFRVYFAEACDTAAVRVLVLAVGDGSGDLLELWLELAPDRAIVWSSEPDDFQQPWYDEPVLPIGEWIDVELDINLVDRSARLRLGEDSSPFPTLWDTTPGFDIAEAHASFGLTVFTGFSTSCTLHVDDVAVVLQ